jgi:glycosyltransferase involved in cell wall biosynthesis
MKVPRILIFCWCVLPLEGGARRILSMVSCLKNSNIPITVIAPLFDGTKVTPEESANIKFVRIRISNNKLQMNLAIKLFALIFYWIKSIPVLVNLTSTRQKTILQYQGTYCAPPVMLVGLFRGSTIIGDDIRLYGMLRSSFIGRLSLWVYEINILKLTSTIITSFAKDFMIMKRKLGLTNSKFLANSVKRSIANEVGRREPTAIFIGSLIEKENRDAVKEILHLAHILDMKQSEINIAIIGGPEHFVSEYLNDLIVKKGRVKFTGYVSDGRLDEFYQKAAFGLLPYFHAKKHTSQRIKVLEFLSSGMAVLASSQAVDGFLDLINKQHYFLVENVDDIADLLEKYSPNSPEIRAVGNQGRDYINKTFSYSAFSSAYVKIVNESINCDRDKNLEN